VPCKRDTINYGLAEKNTREKSRNSHPPTAQQV